MLWAQVELSDRPLLHLGFLLIFVGVQLLSLGIIADLLARTYHESQGKSAYTIRHHAPSSQSTEDFAQEQSDEFSQSQSQESSELIVVDSDNLKVQLKNYFGFDRFHAGQREVIESVLEGKPTLAVMPTGALVKACAINCLPYVLME